MKVKDLDGNIVSLSLSKNPTDNEYHRSKLHIKAREILKNLFPTVRVLEEVSIVLRRGQNAFLDFYIPALRLIVEVHGQQHYKFNTMFHSSAQDFINQSKRDADVEDWCNLNGFRFVELPYSESNDEWTQRITGNKRQQKD